MTSTDRDSTTDDTVDVTLPARTEFVSTVRLLAASFGADVGLSVDEIDDLRLALSEVFTSAVDSDRPGRIAASFRPGAGRVRVEMHAIAPAELVLDDLATTILRSVVDEFEHDAGRVVLVKTAAETQR